MAKLGAHPGKGDGKELKQEFEEGNSKQSRMVQSYERKMKKDTGHGEKEITGGLDQVRRQTNACWTVAGSCRR